MSLASAHAASRTDEEVTAPAEDVSVVSRTVAIGDLNLALPVDQHRLRHRLSVAARRVCMEAGGATAVQDDSMLNCYQASMQDAWAAVQDRIRVASVRSTLLASSPLKAPTATQEVASNLSR